MAVNVAVIVKVAVWVAVTVGVGVAVAVGVGEGNPKVSNATSRTTWVTRALAPLERLTSSAARLRPMIDHAAPPGIVGSTRVAAP